MKEKCESTYNEVSRFAKFRELESIIKVIRAGVVWQGWLFSGHRVSLSSDDNFQKYTVVTVVQYCQWMYLLSLNCILKSGYNCKFHVICILPQFFLKARVLSQTKCMPKKEIKWKDKAVCYYAKWGKLVIIWKKRKKISWRHKRTLWRRWVLCQTSKQKNGVGKCRERSAK